MKKQIETKNMHRNGFRERESLTDETPKTLSKRTIPTLNVCCFTGFLAYLSQFTDFPNQYSNAVYNDQGLARITQSTKWVPYCRIAQDIRKEMQEPTINDDKSAKDFLNAIINKFGASLEEFHFDGGQPTPFSGLFRNSYGRFITYLRERVSSEVVAHFEERLSEGKPPT